MQRHLIGIFGVTLLVAGVVWYVNDSDGRMWQSAFLRVGAILCALWLALPQLRTMPIWLYSTVIGSILLIARWPRMAWVVLPAVIAVWILKPRTGGQANMKSSAPSRRE